MLEIFKFLSEIKEIRTLSKKKNMFTKNKASV